MAQLISAQEVIDFAFTNKNTDITLLGDTFIEIAQEEHIRPVLALGEIDETQSLYQEIVDQNNASTLTAANQTLLTDHIKPCLAFFVKFEILNDMQMNTTSAGVQVNFTEHSNAATNEQRSALSLKVFSHGITLRDKMVRFIEDAANFANYPLYSTGNNIGNVISKTGGIILGSTFTRSIDRR